MTKKQNKKLAFSYKGDVVGLAMRLRQMGAKDVKIKVKF